MGKYVNKLPYRANVAGVVCQNNKFLLLQRIDWEDKYWKFPQGGIDDGETDEQAICRELVEELGTDKFKIIKKSCVTNKYDWDSESIIKAGNRWRGQSQVFFVIEFIGVESDIHVPEEIRAYKWVNLNNLKTFIDHDTKNFTNYFVSIQKVLQEIN